MVNNMYWGGIFDILMYMCLYVCVVDADSRTVFLCGMFAGLCFCITHPIETVKTRVQVMSGVSETRGFLSAMVHILKTEGTLEL